MRVFLFLVLALTISTAFAVDPNFIDTFKGACNDSILWQRGEAATDISIRPQVRTSHGAGGATDSFLWLQAVGGDDAGSSLVMFSEKANWTGDYNAAGVVAIKATVKHLGGDSPLLLRAAIRGSGTWASTEPVRVYAGTGWQRIVFPLNANSMSLVRGGSFVDTMANVNTIRLLSNDRVSYSALHFVRPHLLARGDPQVARLLGLRGAVLQRVLAEGSDSALYATGKCYKTEHGSERYEYEVDARSVRRYSFDDVNCTSNGSSTLHSLETCYNTGEAGELEQFYIIESHCQSEEVNDFDFRLPLITLYENAGCSGSSMQTSVPASSCLPSVLSSSISESVECVGSAVHVTSYSDETCDTTAESEYIPSCVDKAIGNYASFSYDCTQAVYCDAISSLPWNTTTSTTSSAATLNTSFPILFFLASLLALLLPQAM